MRDRRARRQPPGTEGPAQESDPCCLPANSCQPSVPRGFQPRSVFLHAFGSGKCLPAQLKKLTQNYGNCPDMITASLMAIPHRGPLATALGDLLKTSASAKPSMG